MPAVWAEKNICFKYDVSSKIDGCMDLSLTPYLRDVLNAWDFSGKRKEVTVVAPEQTGKSLSWIVGLLWSMSYMPCLSLIIYPSDERGIRINQEKLEPLMKAIPKLKAELEMPRSQRRDSYNFSNLKCYFSGAGSRVTSQSAKIGIADECDDWIEHENKVSNLQDLRKRGRSFDESMVFKVCTPTRKSGTIWKEFERSSQGYWFLRCQGCGKLTMRSADVHNLQFECDEGGEIKPESLVLVCPKCRYEHKESQKRKINVEGDFIHAFPERRKRHEGFQWGALASQWDALNWFACAETQLNAGKSGNIQSKIEFDNSIRGLPFKPHRLDKPQLEALRQHCEKAPDPDKLAGLFHVVDTQDDEFYSVWLGVDENENMYVLKDYICKTFSELREVIEQGWNGLKPLLSIQDSGGHRASAVRQFVLSMSKMYTYRGTNRIAKRIERSKQKEKRLLLAKEQIFRADLLYYLYSQTKRDNNYLFFAPDLSDKFFEHVVAYQKDNSKKGGDEYENWVHNGRSHDFFDCLKMGLALFEYARGAIPGRYWLKESATFAKKQITVKTVSRNSRKSFAKGWK